MARAKIVNTTATETQTERNQTQNHDEVVDPFEFFKDETQECLIAIRRIEPIMENGVHVAGHLPSMTLSPDEARNLAGTLLNRPGCGGGLYFVQHQKRKPSGGYEFASSFRFRVSGRSRALELFDSPKTAEPTNAVVPMLPSQNVVPMQQAPMAWPPYPPYSPPQQYAPPPSPAPQNPDLPGLLRYLGEFVQKQNAPSMDMVQLIQALQKTVHGEDELTKFIRFSQSLQKIAPTATVEPQNPKIDWGSMLVAAKEILKPSAPQAAQPVVGPPGWNWDPVSARWVRAQRPVVDIAAPPGWQWDGQRWSKTTVQTDNEERDEPEDVENAEENDDDSSENDEVYTADQITEFIAEQMSRMPEAEIEKLKTTVKNFANMLE